MLNISTVGGGRIRNKFAQVRDDCGGEHVDHQFPAFLRLCRFGSLAVDRLVGLTFDVAEEFFRACRNRLVPFG